ncbi:LysM peptidoglycan-binding domain-containing protein [Bacillus sp. XF8]|uniref:LysM peptidoglycan-binding domain-containing protein n=1 Tax=Bacillus sp. XF8 TaxID=2819289 RepID=UPI001AA01C0F|nr:LysM peptidoglycan-binding domain-containing protein [Bacillus sp. XF8]MBO1578049.1 LysM peptidoglycan-binding domain-containing protein [Bacillus sp. XF8]
MKLHKMKNLLPISAATITLVSNQGTADAATVHTVKKNDTLWDISSHYGVSVQAIKQTNHKTNDQIYIGEHLTIPVSAPSSEPTPQKNVAASNHSAQVVYQVQRGDTLETIAKQYNVSIQSIRQANNTNGDRIYAGQHLIITTGISEEEFDLMARLVTAEAGSEPYAGKVAVAKVVLNRVDSTEFPNTITDVINQPIKYGYAFTPVTDGRINQPSTPEARMAVEEAISTKGVNSDWLYFYNPKTSTDKWITTRQTVAAIGNHVFAK